MFSQSEDGGASWTLPIEISGRSFDLCPTVECYHDQGSDPVVGPDGTIYVTFSNSDSPNLARQLLMVKCGGCRLLRRARVQDEPRAHRLDLRREPVGPRMQAVHTDSSAYAERVRCQRVDVGSLSVDSAGNLYVVSATFATTRTRPAPVRRTGEAALRQQCLLFVVGQRGRDLVGSARGHSSLRPAVRRNRAVGAVERVTQNGRLWIAFYDRSYGDCEFDGCNDISAAEITNPPSSSPTYRYYRGDDELDAEPDHPGQPDRSRVPRRPDAGRNGRPGGRMSSGRTPDPIRGPCPKRTCTTRGCPLPARPLRLRHPLRRHRRHPLHRLLLPHHRHRLLRLPSPRCAAACHGSSAYGWRRRRPASVARTALSAEFAGCARKRSGKSSRRARAPVRSRARGFGVRVAVGRR